MKKILVIGAGINGILTANAFLEEGFDVTILEESEKCGQKATFANGSQLSFSHTTPIFIKPSFFSKTFSRPFFFSEKTKKWLKKHSDLQSENAEKFHHLTRLAIESNLEFEKIFAKYGWQIEDMWHDFGTAYIFANKKQFEKRKKQFEIQKSEYNFPYKVLKGNDIPDCELALANLSKKFRHAIFTPVDKTLNAIKFTNFMAREFEKNGGKIIYNAKIKRILHGENAVLGIATQGKNFEGYDFYIYAGGASGLGLLEDFNLNLQKVAGYSLTFDVSYSNHCPVVNLIDFTHKVVYSRNGNLLRVAGFFDVDFTNKQKRINDLYKVAITTFPILKRQDLVHTWQEFRVFSANEVPICGKILPNFAVNTAHGHLGITLSAGMAKKILNIFLDN